MIPAAKPCIGDDERAAVDRVLASGMLAQGPQVAAFEEEFSGVVGGRECVAVNSGTSALHLALQAVGLQPGDEVLVPDPYYATYEGVVAACGASFVPVPTLPEDDFHLTPEALEAAITPLSRVLLINTPSNPTGAVLREAEIDAIGEICARRDLWIVSDEVYAELTFDVPFASPFDRPHLRERSVTVASISTDAAFALSRGRGLVVVFFVARFGARGSLFAVPTVSPSVVTPRGLEPRSPPRAGDQSARVGCPCPSRGGVVCAARVGGASESRRRDRPREQLHELLVSVLLRCRELVVELRVGEHRHPRAALRGDARGAHARATPRADGVEGDHWGQVAVSGHRRPPTRAPATRSRRPRG